MEPNCQMFRETNLCSNIPYTNHHHNIKRLQVFLKNNNKTIVTQ